MAIPSTQLKNRWLTSWQNVRRALVREDHVTADFHLLAWEDMDEQLRKSVEPEEYERFLEENRPASGHWLGTNEIAQESKR